MPVTGLPGCCPVVPLLINSAPVEVKLESDEAVNPVVPSTVPFQVKLADAPKFPELLNCSWVLEPAGSCCGRPTSNQLNNARVILIVQLAVNNVNCQLAVNQVGVNRNIGRCAAVVKTDSV